MTPVLGSDPARGKRVTCSACECAHTAGRPRPARRGGPAVGAPPGRAVEAQVRALRGEVEDAGRDAAGAEEAFALARTQLAPLPLPYEKARVDFAHGLTLRRLGRRRDAAERLTTARAAFAALGAQVYVARYDRELKTGRPAPRGTAADVLTEQERTVAALVAS